MDHRTNHQADLLNGVRQQRFRWCGMQFAAAGARVLANGRRMGLGVELPGDFFL